MKILCFCTLILSTLCKGCSSIYLFGEISGEFPPYARNAAIVFKMQMKPFKAVLPRNSFETFQELCGSYKALLHQIKLAQEVFDWESLARIRVNYFYGGSSSNS
ncbi:hypothetical protein CDAR_519211 [Caerostris darwini]|uniref:Uncharacterized protein n=1 Tax=Caerostris darwini TaxID=1538125 RepID=A0AAV4PQD6_9ARAC|nr:hypothetical protein CDAR_519211 [Caerostris darwini]